MKQILGIIAVGAVLGTNAWAVPFLQLDISGGLYDADPNEESVISTGTSFSLYALLNTESSLRLNPNIAGYAISMAIVPKDLVSPSTDFGSFSINGTSYSNSDMIYGQPPVASEDLQKHGIFDTLYREVQFSFNPNNKAALYNVQDNPGGFTTSATGTLLYHSWDVDVSGLLDAYELHFDLYAVTASGALVGKDYKAPFSHDAQSGGEKVPDGGATLGLAGLALLGLLGMRRCTRAP